MQIVEKSVCIYLIIFIFNTKIRIGGKPIAEDDPDEVDPSDMDAVQKGAAVEMPRNAIAYLLQKGQFFQDIFSEQPTPNKIEFGHVCENPREWEQRFEQKDLKNNRHQGKVRWGNTNGGYGEHYWDLNHAGGTSEEDK
ncbi:uncharacterized protein LOC107220076 [Neodiprion lecontei]|uniref:Uncharacterized protein LOC107220076 n=1 Tax=Neodiprion lecontei TaxID=441921 RepID=A0ABM3FMN0_NEOLC|nr:uncharacterized protein LOC107220076 [Neodiprion lecontei]